MKRFWKSLVHWFEYGDLVPLIVIVSAVHYAIILRSYDWYPVAVAIGLMVDLGHFRTVRAAVRYTGADLRQKSARWGMAAFMTCVAVAYQQRFYADWWLSLPLPFLIAALAWLQYVDRNVGKRSESGHMREIVESAPQLQPKKIAQLPAHICECGRSFDKQQGLAAHKRHCTYDAGKINGKIVEYADSRN